MADLDGSDQFAVYTGSDHRKITADQLSQNYNGSYANYKLAVYNTSNGNHYSVKCSELGSKISSSNQSSYLFMISRGSTLYKVAAEKVLGLLGGMWSVSWKDSNTGGSGVTVYDAIPNDFGEVYVIGHTITGANAWDTSDGFVALIDSTGSVLWQRKIGGSSYERAITGDVDSSGNLSLAGMTYTDTAGAWDTFFASYSRTGSVSNRTRIGTGETELPKSMVSLSNGNFLVGAQYVTSSTYAVFFELDSNLSKAYGGNRYVAAPNYGASCSCITVDNNGSVYIGGSDHDRTGISNGYEGGAFIAKSTNGSLDWNKVYTSPSPPNSPQGRNISVKSIAIVNGNEPVGTIMEQMRWDNNSNISCGIVKYDTNGNLSWYRRFAPAGGFSNTLSNNDNFYVPSDQHHCIDTDSDNNIYVTSNHVSAGGSNHGALLVKISYSGNLIWARKLTYTDSTAVNGASVHIDQKGDIIFGVTNMVLRLTTDGDFIGTYGSQSRQFQITNHSMTLATSMIGTIKTRTGNTYVSTAGVAATTSASTISSSNVLYTHSSVEIP